METCILSFRHASGREGWWQEQQQQSWLAFNLCKAPGVWVCHLKVFLFIHNDPKGRKRERKPLPQGGGMDHVKEQKVNQLAVWQAPSSFHPAPTSRY